MREDLRREMLQIRKTSSLWAVIDAHALGEETALSMPFCFAGPKPRCAALPAAQRVKTSTVTSTPWPLGTTPGKIKTRTDPASSRVLRANLKARGESTHTALHQTKTSIPCTVQWNTLQTAHRETNSEHLWEAEPKTKVKWGWWILGFVRVSGREVPLVLTMYGSTSNP